MTEPIYLDYNGTTPLAPEVVKIISETLISAWGNPSSSHPIGLKAQAVISRARQQVCEMVGCTPEEVVFTSGGTEANNMVLYSVTRDQRMNKKRKISNGVNHNQESNGVETNGVSLAHVVISNVEHDSVSKCAHHLRDTGQITLTEVELRDGMLLVEDVVSACTVNTRLVSVMLANNETGVVFPISHISAAVKAQYPGVLVHTDAAQAIGKLELEALNVNALNVDFLTIVGHKFYGPRIGALFVRQQAPYTPLLYGGGQEGHVRPGTENTPMIAGLGAACALVTKHCHYTKLRTVRDYLESRLTEELGSEVIINCSQHLRLPNTSNFAIMRRKKGCSFQNILQQAETFIASKGAACHSGNTAKPSQILLNSGVAENVARHSIRVSIGKDTTEDDIDVVMNEILCIVKYNCRR